MPRIPICISPFFHVVSAWPHRLWHARMAFHCSFRSSWNLDNQPTAQYRPVCPRASHRGRYISNPRAVLIAPAFGLITTGVWCSIQGGLDGVGVVRVGGVCDCTTRMTRLCIGDSKLRTDSILPSLSIQSWGCPWTNPAIQGGVGIGVRPCCTIRCTRHHTAVPSGQPHYRYVTTGW